MSNIFSFQHFIIIFVISSSYCFKYLRSIFFLANRSITRIDRILYYCISFSHSFVRSFSLPLSLSSESYSIENTSSCRNHILRALVFIFFRPILKILDISYSSFFPFFFSFFPSLLFPYQRAPI